MFSHSYLSSFTPSPDRSAAINKLSASTTLCHFISWTPLHRTLSVLLHASVSLQLNTHLISNSFCSVTSNALSTILPLQMLPDLFVVFLLLLGRFDGHFGSGSLCRSLLSQTQSWIKSNFGNWQCRRKGYQIFCMGNQGWAINVGNMQIPKKNKGCPNHFGLLWLCWLIKLN